MASSNSQPFQSNPFHRDLCLPRVEVNEFDGSDPTGWVTQMEYNLSLNGIIDYLEKLHYSVYIWILNIGNGDIGVKNHTKDMFLGHNLWRSFINSLTSTHTPWVISSN